jgi:hypothetical protein
LLGDVRVEFRRLGHRLDIELLTQSGRKIMVGLERAGPVARLLPQRHERANRVFAPGVVAQQSLRVLERALAVAARTRRVDEFYRKFALPFAKAIAERAQPLVVEPFGKVGTVEVNDLGSPIHVRRQPLEFNDIEPQRGCGIPLNRPPIADDPGRFGRRQSAADQIIDYRRSVLRAAASDSSGQRANATASRASGCARLSRR